MKPADWSPVLPRVGERSIRLRPLLMPSGPQLTERWTDCHPPPLIHYDWYHYKVSSKPCVASGTRLWPDGAWVCELIHGAQKQRESCQDGSCVTMGWRFAIGEDMRPWESGDPQPQDECWPYFIAVFGTAEVAAANAIHIRGV